MIKVNLLNKKRKKKQANPIQFELVAFILAVVVVFAGIYVVDDLMKTKTAYLEEQVSVKQGELRKLRVVKQEIDGFKSSMDEIQKKIDLVRSLKAGQKGYYKILTNIEDSMPDDVWLSSLSYETDKIVLNCSSLRVSSVNRFVMNMYETNMFSAIDLDKADKKDEQAVEVNNFVITANVRLD